MEGILSSSGILSGKGILYGSGIFTRITDVYEWDEDAKVYLNTGDAIDYAATGLNLEDAVARAMNEWLFIAAKQPGTAPIAANAWEALKAGTALNMSGWRTLEAALLPLHASMPTPTNVNFVQGDYDRVTGLASSSGKYLPLSLAQNALPQDDFSLWGWITSGTGTLIGFEGAFTTGSSQIAMDAGFVRWRSRTGGDSSATATTATSGFIGHSRNSGSEVKIRAGGITTMAAANSDGASSSDLQGFRVAAQVPLVGRAPFLSVSRAIDLAAMDASLTAYMAALTAALP